MGARLSKRRDEVRLLRDSKVERATRSVLVSVVARRQPRLEVLELGLLLSSSPGTGSASAATTVLSVARAGHPSACGREHQRWTGTPEVPTSDSEAFLKCG